MEWWDTKDRILSEGRDEQWKFRWGENDEQPSNKILSTTRVMVMMNFFPGKVTEVRRRVVWDIWGRGMNEKDILKGGKRRK